MAFEAKVLQVLIASPSDVQQERIKITETIYQWNALNSEEQKIVLLPVKWETHVSSEYSGADTQEILNKQFVRSCDILIGVFWSKIGTPTLKSSSGTLEEIEEFIHAGKPIKLYFASKDIPQDADLDQIAHVRSFKQAYQGQGIYMSYSSIENLESLLMTDLTREVRKFRSPTSLVEDIDTPKQRFNLVSLPNAVEKKKKTIRKQLNSILNENERIFLEYGPHSIRANNPLSQSAHMWKQKCLESIIPNNDKIIHLLQNNIDLITEDKICILSTFITHTEGLKQNYLSEFKDRNVPLFPKDIKNILD
ncbi:hypothetical protein ACIQD3_11725 [Peribacillus loiseleuriae]|uniref:hypothetical protein n=1 Tax=Peribacillus loiseleuriae TaxID=1679170 RepID=UPI0038064057